ncbi:MAG: trypsin-like peptidase domain-containing protein [Planctomycetaceae bacterium]|nr:trypsin-like peptidase domain-containing protein [Planctomycetaceae bacterium]
MRVDRANNHGACSSGERRLEVQGFVSSILVVVTAFVAVLALATPVKAQSKNTLPTTAGSLDEWRQREAAVQQVVADATDAVVAITDQESFGSGVIVSPDGLVLTAGHVILSPAREFTILLPNGKTAKAKPLGKNLNHDAGMLQIEETGPWPHVEIGEASGLRRGTWVVALGHSGGYDLGRRPPVRIGRILQTERDALTTDCPIIGGDSGGPLFNLEGQVIGIHSSIGESIAENRHVSVQTFLRDWDRLKAGESWGQLPGTRSNESDGEDAAPPRRERRPPREPNPGKANPAPPLDSAVLGVELDLQDQVAILRVIKPDSAAERVGLRVGDVVESFNGVAIQSPQELIDQIAAKRAGDSVKVVVRRGAERIEYQIILGQLQTK